MSITLRYPKSAPELISDVRTYLETRLGGGSLKVECVETDSMHPGAGADAELVFLTDDCLEACFELKQNGVSFFGAPTYSPAGLCAAFVGPAGNVCMLLEERDYSEDSNF